MVVVALGVSAQLLLYTEYDVMQLMGSLTVPLVSEQLLGLLLMMSPAVSCWRTCA